MTSAPSGGLPPATAYHRLPIRLLNRLWRMANACGLARVSLDASEMMDTVRRETGLSDFGDPRFLEPYKLLCRCLQTEANLNPAGRLLTRISLLRILRHRVWAEALIKKHPEILEREIKAPVVVVGLARSGTTRLHRLLAADPGFLHLKSWETVNPVPWPDSYGAERDPRITSIEKGLKAVLYMSPQMASVHPLGAHEVEEEVGLIQHAFSSQLFEVMTYIPSFAEHLMQHDQTYAYEYMVRLMKIVSWWRGDDDRPWVLKTPQHMQDLDSLIKVFPDARLICSHRDPIRAVGSACSMTWNAMVRDTDSVDPHWVGREWLDKTDAMLRKTLEVRSGVPAQQQTDVLYADINRDWRAAIKGIYDFLDRPLTDEALANMQAWLDSNAQHKH
ncbi:MAG: sulfotransferase, partial [Spongiibacteraceae bacterium]|nr:sulfotransferase [Spongiibacteraceae bacterium]